MHDYAIFFIDTVRNSFPNAVEIYAKDNCYKFHLILKAVFPSASYYRNSTHVITKIRDRYYDITGEVEKTDHVSEIEYYSHNKN